MKKGIRNYYSLIPEIKNFIRDSINIKSIIIQYYLSINKKENKEIWIINMTLKSAVWTKHTNSIKIQFIKINIRCIIIKCNYQYINILSTVIKILHIKYFY